jgi:hypothetical protein
MPIRVAMKSKNCPLANYAQGVDSEVVAGEAGRELTQGRWTDVRGSI